MSAQPSDSDAQWMAAAFREARKGVGHTRPNPPVGAVIVKDGILLGSGFHARAGGPHAEAAAIEDALKNGAEDAIRGSTLYVTLEPCSVPGRVGACTDAIARAGISRVVYAAQDPNPANAGKAREALAPSGAVVERLPRIEGLSGAIDDMLKPFAKHVTTGLPFVTVKIAMSLDGRTHDSGGNAKWISSERARETTNALRLEADAIMVGAETVRKDNPSLLARPVENPDLLRVVVSRSGNLPREAQVFTDGKNRTVVFRDAREAVEQLGRMGMMHVLCEGGLKLAAGLAKEGLVDRWLTVLAPIAIGDGPLKEAARIAEAECLRDW